MKKFYVGSLLRGIMMIVLVMAMGVKGWGQVINDYQSASSGTWLAGTATWERFDGTFWNPSTAPANNTSNNIYIKHAISANGSFGNTIKLILELGGTFTVTAASNTSSILINSGGVLQINAALTNGGNFIIESGGRANIRTAERTSHPATSRTT